MCRFRFFITFENFLAIISSNILSLSLLSFWDSSYTYVHVLDGILHVSEVLLILLNLFFFLFLNLNNLNGPILKTANSLLSAQIFC